MRFHFAALEKRKVRHFFKRSLMDNSPERDADIFYMEDVDVELQDFMNVTRNAIT